MDQILQPNFGSNILFSERAGYKESLTAKHESGSFVTTRLSGFVHKLLFTLKLDLGSEFGIFGESVLQVNKVNDD
jgi:hypothetical protein